MPTAVAPSGEALPDCEAGEAGSAGLAAMCRCRGLPAQVDTVTCDPAGMPPRLQKAVSPRPRCSRPPLKWTSFRKPLSATSTNDLPSGPAPSSACACCSETSSMSERRPSGRCAPISLVPSCRASWQPAAEALTSRTPSGRPAAAAQLSAQVGECAALASAAPSECWAPGASPVQGAEIRGCSP